jgi:ligand-binding sensor domain-containing protein
MQQQATLLPWFRQILLPAVLLLLFHPLCSQTTPDDCYHFTTENGLPSDVVYFIHQDSRGFIWFATEQGVCRYDGYEFTQFPGENVNPLDAFVIREDEQGRIWFNTMTQGLYYIENDSIHAYRYNHLITDVVSDVFFLEDFWVAEKGKILAFPKGEGVMEIDSNGATCNGTAP